MLTSTGLGPAPPIDLCLPLLDALPDLDLEPPPILDFLAPPPLPTDKVEINLC